MRRTPSRPPKKVYSNVLYERNYPSAGGMSLRYCEPYRLEDPILKSDLKTWQEIDQFFADRNDRIPRASATVRNRPGLMKIVVYGINSHRAEISHPAIAFMLAPSM